MFTVLICSILQAFRDSKVEKQKQHLKNAYGWIIK